MAETAKSSQRSRIVTVWGTFATVTGSKRMTPEQQARLVTVGQVRALVVDAVDETNVLIDTTIPACEFSTGGTPGLGIARFASGSILKLETGASGSITTLARTMMFSNLYSP